MSEGLIDFNRRYYHPTVRHLATRLLTMGVLSDGRVAQLLATAEGILADAARRLYECARFQLPEHSEGG